ncbi:amino acid permease [Dactylosporangium sp. AC04546]|uniref:hypothetical protein n=1 Tax=Dactylosporangium sp. AC04546 TaxID=2862460 RepID=UPI002E7AD7FD|nr:hypothetical protein [Dactylosporangium sp. AC04546]WVK78603.1 amino acid permease [Dactylosporangium sp. AC04546]
MVTSPTVARASPLHRGLTSGQIGMLTIGGVIGTGLFLGSGLAVSMAGPTVLLTFVVGGLLAIALTYAATEMALARPDLHGFGAFTHRYLGPLAGFTQRWLYWGVVAISTGFAAAVAMAAVVVSMLFVGMFRVAWILGAPTVVVIVVTYALTRTVRRTRVHD